MALTVAEHAETNLAFGGDESSVGDELRLLPPLGRSPAEMAAAENRWRMSRVRWQARRAAQRKQPQCQFSLLEILVITTAVSCGLAAATWLPSRTIAGLFGLLTCLSLVLFRPKSRPGHLLWYTMILIYGATLTFALFRAG